LGFGEGILFFLSPAAGALNFLYRYTQNGAPRALPPAQKLRRPGLGYNRLLAAG
jgi:hypothetical protein